jgi:hypothetical protein
MSEIKEIAAKLRDLFAQVTPQAIDTAERKDDGTYECPFCGGEGEVNGESYTNFDKVAIGVQFFGVGPEHVRAEKLYRALIEYVPRLLDLADPALTSPKETNE